LVIFLILNTTNTTKKTFAGRWFA